MTTTLAILGALGGAAAFFGGVAVVARGIFKLVSSTDSNTRALGELNNKIQQLTVQVNGNHTDIEVLKAKVFHRE